MKINTDDKKIKELISKGVEEIIEKKSLVQKLKSGKKLRVKLGIDPTGPKIHIGRALQFQKLKQFQELGHQIILIIGDFTAQIGDASDKQAMRKPLSEKEIKENMKSYKEQIGKIINLEKTEIHYNSEWFNKMKLKEIISLAMNFTAQQMIQRKNFKERWDSNKPIGLHELLYPLLQGYDSVMVKADIEIGGSDQLFNLKTGREIQKIFNQPQQDIITLKMLYGTDGRKMSTSWGNIITIIDKPFDIFGKIMSMKDELIPHYLELCTDIPLKEIKKIEKDLSSKKVNPKEIKIKLAKEIIKNYYNKKEADEAEKEFNKIFVKKEIPTKTKEIKINEKNIPFLDLLVKTGLASSKSEAKRLILQNAVKIDNKVLNDWKKNIEIKKGMIIQVGKRKFIKIN
ncbi:MAG TPA: tyrosine--tRNA ligase [Candidatus Pacearchaeota archaeon]|nr:tyrosine--tRNA ligase [Candidatus Paceibacterota bacterium]HOK00828.1 tyrosine--tRNA ligase [Candidatus Pacearchaeota archaeon]